MILNIILLLISCIAIIYTFICLRFFYLSLIKEKDEKKKNLYDKKGIKYAKRALFFTICTIFLLIIFLFSYIDN